MSLSPLSLPVLLFPLALVPSPLLFHNLFALRLSNKSHLIVHFLSWPGAWCQTSCMKCSFTAFPASTFVQRENNKKSHRASWTLWGFFFSFFWRGGETALDSLFVLPPCPLKGILQPSLVVTREDLIFSHDWESHVSVWLLWIVIVKTWHRSWRDFQRSLLKFGVL